MTNSIFQKAETIRAKIAARGLRVGQLHTSINRNGDFSAYFDCEGGDRIRVSDHDTVCEDSFKWLAGTSDEAVERFARRRRWNIAVAAELAIIHKAAFEREANVRRAAFAAEQDRAATNDAMLVAAGFDPAAMTKNQRKDALKRLRKGD